ncbi:hypothetical protein CAC42_709 [Sphaceloma murrayae]|uniref:Uncharacterized protein n=1 Tax=Sphaceloma murrayae TaxID=2082308 RepID=A0A2K1QKP3_9PEZI|nr:hypothetical protein CAC42_709 [Sphaceloma murrayae]
MARVLLVGATATIAPTLLSHLLSSPFISHIVLLSRKSITSATTLANDKITQLLHPDFSTFPDQLFLDLRDRHRVQAVVWLVGGFITRFKSFDEAQEANVSLPLRFLEGCLEHGLVSTPAGLKPDGVGEDHGAEEAKTRDKGKGRVQRYVTPDSSKMPFRFAYLSTYNAVQDPFASLWTDAKFRRLKGAGEKALLDLAAEKGQGMCEVYCLRIGRVLEGQTVGNVVRMGMGGYISDELLGKKILSLCLGGRGDEKYGERTGGGVLENEEVMGDGWADVNSVTING